MPDANTSNTPVNATDDAADQAGTPSIIADGSSPPSATYLPGIIEIQLKKDVNPTIASATSVSAPTADMGALNQVLQDLGVTKIAPSFQLASADGGVACASATTDGSGSGGGSGGAASDPALADLPSLNSFLTLTLPDGADLNAALQKLRAVAEVELAMPVPDVLPPVTGDPLTGTTDQVAADPATGLENQWYIYRCGFDQAWSQSDGTNVVIADIDFGFRLTHEDLTANINSSKAYNAVDGSTNVGQGSETFHGTGVLGLAGAALNSKGIVGAAFCAELWPIQANTGGTALAGYAWANAIEWVASQDSAGKRKIINLEVQTKNFGNIEQVPSVNAAIRRAIARNVVVCVAAGNGNRDATLADDNTTPIPPTGSILVGATSYDPASNPRASFSNYGATVMIAAPGDSNHDVTCSASGDSAYTNKFGGTSGATPKVSGAVALMLAANPKMTHAEVRDTLNAQGGTVVTDAAKPVGNLLNAAKAVAEAKRLTTLQPA